ncbi:TPA: hypothetical protein G8O64_004795 [Salmonella enterica]|uniref:Uncharacterized protein n=1 Tax=Salmonella enterica TaxID=28901 RepID=A0A759H4S7_SALER|nr:hypothetical protein [Salmonella enterica]HAG5359072.1 hypothetical protein [Salmonella enterica]HDN7460012.1 hypothetical protein [Salmonella enterica subsp. enterica serovar Eastbourne]HDN7577069.1 hypothetical protein [Salmonella enterica subsp. enterica serovar Eastbourne]
MSPATLEQIDDCGMLCDVEYISYAVIKNLKKHLDELYICIGNNKVMLPNYGEMYRYGEPVAHRCGIDNQ